MLTFFVSGDQIQKFFNQKELQLKCLLSCHLPSTFNAVELCVAIINEKPWTRVRGVCKALEHGKAIKTTDVVRHLCSRENYVISDN